MPRRDPRYPNRRQGQTLNGPRGTDEAYRYTAASAPGADYRDTAEGYPLSRHGRYSSQATLRNPQPKYRPGGEEAYDKIPSHSMGMTGGYEPDGTNSMDGSGEDLEVPQDRVGWGHFGYMPEGHDAMRRWPGDDRDEEPPIDENQLVSIVQRELDSSLGWTGTRLAEARRRNLNEYLGNSRGDERSGHSSVISREVFEQVEWALPQIMEVFSSSNHICQAIPQGPEDQEGAEQATDACNWIYRQQKGFTELLTAVKDALIQKNGILKVQWDDSKTTTIETYEGKTYGEFVQLEQDPNFEIRSTRMYVQEQNPETGEIEDIELPPDALEQVPPELIKFDVRGVRTNQTGHVAIDAIPPEEFIINRDARSLEEDDYTCRFVGDRIRSTESELISMGYDRDLVQSLPGSQSVYTTDQDWIIRASQDDGQPLVHSYRNDSERTIHVNDCYLRVDMDGDGISEWWRVVVAGEYGQVLLSADPVAGHPYAAGTPIPIPHRFFGLAIADVTTDLQNINTTLWRQYLDARYLDTDPRYVVFSQGIGEAATPMVNLNQLVRSTPGSYIEEYERGALRPMERSDNSDTILPAFENNKDRLMVRTGISPEAQGVTAESISNHVYGAIVQQSAAQQRVLLYAKIFAETLVKGMFRLILRELCMNQTEPMMLRLRGKWVEMHPSEWSTQMDFEMAVGVGAGSKFEKSSNLQMVASLQEKLLGSPFAYMVGDDQVYNTAARMIENTGFKDVEQFVRNPDSPEAQQDAMAEAEQPNPAQEALELEQRAKMMELELEVEKLRLEQQKAAWNHEEEMLKLRLQDKRDEQEFGVDAAEVEIKRQAAERQTNGSGKQAQQ